jgi:fructose-bisphosphate aldolase class I
MNNTQLRETAQKILSRTILAADESTTTIKKRLTAIGVESTPETNRKYRQLLFTAPHIGKYVSGVILYDETIRQAADDNTPFPALLEKQDIVPGIKVDKGTSEIPNLGVDTYTTGFDGLSERLKEYYSLGARFAKWRAVYTIMSGNPTRTSIERNAHDLALYALLCQQENIVPIVEPEVLMDGEHDINTDKEITTRVLTMVFHKLKEYKVDLQGMILKPNMVTAGSKNSTHATVEEVAKTTLAVLKHTVPAEVPGIAFLSGGQSPDIATVHLQKITALKNTDASAYPWRITASYGRALQGEALEAWGGKQEHIAKAQEIFISRAEKIYNASLGLEK